MNSLHDAPNSFDIDRCHFTFYRRAFPFGDYDAYMCGHPRYRFWANGKIMTPNELADYLAANYSQTTEVGIRSAMSGHSDLRALPC